MMFQGDFTIGDRSMTYASGASLARFPAHGRVIKANLNDQAADLLEGETVREENVPILGEREKSF